MSKADFSNHLPPHLVEENLKANISETCDGQMGDLLRRFEEMQVQVDQKVVSLRQDFDMSLLKKSIEKKANRADLSTMFDNHDYKLLTLDNNFLLLAQDLETFQKHMNKIQKSV